jgi:hypothetical protein
VRRGNLLSLGVGMRRMGSLTGVSLLAVVVALIGAACTEQKAES